MIIKGLVIPKNNTGNQEDMIGIKLRLVVNHIQKSRTK